MLLELVSGTLPETTDDGRVKIEAIAELVMF